MRPKLLKSFIVVTLFWFIASTLWWSLASPEVNLAALKAVQKLLPFLDLKVPAEANIFAAWRVQLTVLTYWTVPVLIAATLFGALGLGIVWSLAFKREKERTARESGSGVFRRVTVTKGAIPTPVVLPRHELDLGSADDEMLSRLTEKELALLTEILGTLSAHEDSFAGDGVTVTLLEHALNLASKALTRRRSPGLSAIVAAAHELGKITAYRMTGDRWELKPNASHDKHAAKILASLEAWWGLPEADRIAVMLAVRYHSRPRQIPTMNGDPGTYRQARDLLEAIDDTQAEAMTEQKQKTLEKTELPDVLFETFTQSIPQLTFQSRGLPKGVAAVAWKVKTRVYMLEIKLRETMMAKLPPEVSGALKPNPKERVRVQPFTVELLKALDARGWLVKQIDDVKVETKEALWNVQAGKLAFKGVIVIEVPPEFLQMLPRDDSMYELSVTGPLFTPSNQTALPGIAISKDDLLGSVLKKAP
jgi:hypothetical protein